MKIKKPDIAKVLSSTVNLLNAEDNAVDIVQQHIKDIDISGFSAHELSFRGVIFENCKLLDCDWEKASFIDVIFKNCDLSNSNFHDAYFNTCELIGGKAVGLNLQNASLQHVLISDCNFDYAYFDNSKFNSVIFKLSDLSNVSFTEVRFQNVELDEVKLHNTCFFKTSLRDIDFTSCQMSKIGLSNDFRELRGAVVNLYQAADLAKLLGVVVK